MTILKGMLDVFKYAILAALLVIAIFFTLFSLVALSPLGGLYFLGMIVFIFAPPALIIGAIFGAFQAYSKRQKAKVDEVSQSHLQTGLGITIGLVIMIGIGLIPYFTVDQKRIVVHEASWSTRSSEGECEVDIIVLRHYAYGVYSEICSGQLLSHLQTQNQVLIPVTYEVTSDFGEIRGYGLRELAGITLEARDWMNTHHECGGEYFAPCDSPKVDDDSFYYESSWTGN